MAASRITTRNARFQQWHSLLANRNKRQRAREFLVQGVRPLSVAAEHGWPVRTLIHSTARPLSRWAEELLRGTRAERVAMAPELLAELGEKSAAEPPEIVAVMEMPEDDLDRIGARTARTRTSSPASPAPSAGTDTAVGGTDDSFLGLLFDRPTSPGNIGSVIRSADAFGADGLIVTGHAADVYDPKSVRASTGSLFALPAVRVPSAREVTGWLEARQARGLPPVKLVGTDEHGEADLFDFDLTGPALLLIGNETAGLSAAWRAHCDHTVRIPMAGSASSLNAANAATTVLYEASRQRRTAAAAAAAAKR